jgi:hypothetical protein
MWIVLHLKLSVNRALTERHQSINSFHCCIFDDPTAMQPRLSLIEELPTWMVNIGRVNVATPQVSMNKASTTLGHASCIIDVVYCGVYT